MLGFSHKIFFLDNPSQLGLQLPKQTSGIKIQTIYDLQKNIIGF